MLTFFFVIVDTLLPILIMFFIFRIIVKLLQSILTGSQPKNPVPDADSSSGYSEERSSKDLAGEFEAKLKAKSRKKSANDMVVTDEKLKVYKEQLQVEQKNMNTAGASISSPNINVKEQKKQWKNPVLVNGFIMSQILEKPRSINPYEDRL